MKKITILSLFVILVAGLSLSLTTEAQANNNSVILVCEGINNPGVQGANGAGPKGEEAVAGDEDGDCDVADGKLDCCDVGDDFCWECMAQLRSFGMMLVGQTRLSTGNVTYTYED